MDNILITGASGFVAYHLLEYLKSICDLNIIGLDINKVPNTFSNKYDKVEYFSLNNEKKVNDFLVKYKPKQIYHLASYSSVSYSWNEPKECFYNNTNSFLSLVESIRTIGFDTRILSVGSSEEYGSIDESKLPIKENSSLNPISPYAIARVSQEQFSILYNKAFGLDIICTRSFNHLGPFQSDKFVISSFVRQLLEYKYNNKKPSFGNLNIVRDFIDVRDVARAYHIIMNKGESGNIYNVCSSIPYSLSEILKKIILKIDIDIDPSFYIDNSRIRPTDIPVIYGDNLKLINDLDFSIKYDIDDSLRDIINYWDTKIHD